MYTDLLMLPQAGGTGGAGTGAGGGVTGGGRPAGMQAGFASVLASFLGALHGAGGRADAGGKGLMWPEEAAEGLLAGDGQGLNAALLETLSPEEPAVMLSSAAGEGEAADIMPGGYVAVGDDSPGQTAWQALLEALTAAAKGEPIPALTQEQAQAVWLMLTQALAAGDGEQVPALTSEQVQTVWQALAQALAAAGDDETVPALTREQAQTVWQTLAQALAAAGDEEAPVLTREQVQMVREELAQALSGDPVVKGAGSPGQAVTTSVAAQQTTAQPTLVQPVTPTATPQMPNPNAAAETRNPATFTPLQGLVPEDEIAGLVKPETAAAAEEAAPQQATTVARAETPLVFPTGMEVREAAAAETRSPAPMPTQALEETVARQVIYRVLGELEQLRGQTGKMVRLELQLHPPELGRVVVRLLWQTGGLEARFLTGDQTVRGALEQALPQLREALGRQDVNLLDVSADLARDQDDQPLRQGPRGRGLVRYQTAHDEPEDAARLQPEYGTARVIDRLA